MKKIIERIQTIRNSKKIIRDMRGEINNEISLEAESIPFLNKPGIIFTFDDGFRIRHWYDYGIGKKSNYNDLFGYFDVKATFNINAYHLFENQRELTQSEIDMLLELQANGHEIAHHGYKHRNSVEYTRTYGLNSWIEDDISLLIEWMAKQKHSISGDQFKCPVSFAFPGSKYNEETCEAIVTRFFKIARGYLKQDNLISMQHTGFSPSVCIDENVFPNIKLLKPALFYAKETGRNLVLMGHSILPKNINWDNYGWGEGSKEAGKYRISPENIEYIINEAKKIGLEFYTMAEAAGIATFIDHRLEGAIREQLNIKEKWIYIKDLLKIKELNLEGKGISNLAGIEYLTNLEKLNIINNKNLNNMKLLNKLKRIKKLEM
ncbi:polysaccharide deacetylase family protein [Paenibacillus sp. LMG 31456]|uniref:Polysaccharide deacetylase family protein n=1 Tax=Paenibacillus foliorum TaxID=2654974 RepID=A0A972H2L5_9BACL|nr:polysaccharide deacetylase family protein [Paenibacillus foliorum]NOU95116.1 polysaccharide deacetylase family protein [Paenibacillus foliorum]